MHIPGHDRPGLLQAKSEIWSGSLVYFERYPGQPVYASPIRPDRACLKGLEFAGMLLVQDVNEDCALRKVVAPPTSHGRCHVPLMTLPNSLECSILQSDHPAVLTPVLTPARRPLLRTPEERHILGNFVGKFSRAGGIPFWESSFLQ